MFIMWSQRNPQRARNLLIEEIRANAEAAVAALHEHFRQNDGGRVRKIKDPDRMRVIDKFIV